jgi:hypothetical protein
MGLGVLPSGLGQSEADQWLNLDLPKSGRMILGRRLRGGCPETVPWELND